HMRVVLAPLRAMAQRTRCAVLLVRHLNKNSKVTDPLLRGGSSIGIIAAARAGLMVGRDPDDPKRRVLAVTKANLAPGEQPSLGYRLVTDATYGVAAIDWIGVSPHSARDLLDAESPAAGGAVGDAVAVLREFLEEGPQLAVDCKRFCKEAGIAYRTLDRAKKTLGIKAAPKMNGKQKHWWWSLPEEAREEREDRTPHAPL